MKTVHIDNFCFEVNKSIVEFNELWYKKHQINPEQYPLELEEKNSGLWYEFFTQYLLTGEI